MTTPHTKRRPGRPQAAPDARRSARVELRLTESQRNKLERLGGAEWVRRRIDAAKEPHIQAVAAVTDN